MPGLTISTDSISPRTSNAPAPATAPPPSTSVADAATPATTSTAGATNPPVHQTPPRTSRSSSPARPPVSPITPTLPPARLSDPVAPFAVDRPVLTHISQPPTAAAIPPPRPDPIDFDSNPDVLALKSAISILQMQSRKATADIQALSAAKNAAVENPTAFLADLGAGKVHAQGDRLFPESDSDSDDGAEGKKAGQEAGEGSARQGKARAQPQPWETLPKPQNVVRCPPINWSQYAVVGESLDKIHADQMARPSQGAPATLGPNGSYEFKGDSGGNQRPFIGVAAPYNPGKDKIDKKAKGGKR
ncbi:hypothetical protein QIS74_00614 [Colletotrichum tabaci]|uniref:Uncharacterized protein n=1 Tax=Colletotrichum tabaci TaxID=1209068 RepID=A0AAV9TTY8_9PEZI